MAGEVKPFLLATPGAICRHLIVIYLKSNRIEISVINLTTFHRITRLQLLAPNPN